MDGRGFGSVAVRYARSYVYGVGFSTVVGLYVGCFVSTGKGIIIHCQLEAWEVLKPQKGQAERNLEGQEFWKTYSLSELEEEMSTEGTDASAIVVSVVDVVIFVSISLWS